MHLFLMSRLIPVGVINWSFATIKWIALAVIAIKQAFVFFVHFFGRIGPFLNKNIKDISTFQN